MKLIYTISLVIVFCINPAHAFLGDYNSATDYDSAVIAAIKQKTNVSYKFENDRSINTTNKIFSIGLSKTLNSRAKLFGSFNYKVDGEIDEIGYELESGYSTSFGGGYSFIDQDTFILEGHGQLDYLIEEIYKSSDASRKYSLSGYNLLTGLIAKYSLHYNFSVYTGIQLLLLSSIEEERSWSESRDVEMEDSVGAEIGCFYDEESWFLKAEYEFGMGDGFGLTTGIKF
jgi:hypothetical protein